MLSSAVATILGFAALAQAAPLAPEAPQSVAIEKRGFDCGNPVRGLNQGDCQHMSNIGMAGQGDNSGGNNGNIWVGNDGPNTFTFTNRANAGVIVVVWHSPPGDFQSSFMNARRPKVSWSLPNSGDSVTVSLANGVSGGWSSLVQHQTTLSQWGQIFNTWGEFTTGNFATVDISREINMGGTSMSARASGGCLTDMNTCVFTCKNGNSCGDRDTYRLDNCQPGSQPGATFGLFDNQPSGGCQGWSNGGHIDISLGH